jgi:tetratricopeptide (TPR) repeat protein
LQREIAAAYLRLGMVQGNPTTANLGDLEGARASSQHALSIGLRLLEKNPADRDARRTVALAQEKLSDVEAWSGEVPAALAHARQALESWRVLSEGKTDKAASMLPVAVSYVKLGDVLGNPLSPNRGDHSGAMGAYQSSLRILQALPPEEGKAFGVRRYIAILHERIGDMHLLGKRYGDATASFEQALIIREALAAENVTNRNALRDLGIAHEKICSVHLAEGDGRAALPGCRQAVAIYERLYAADQRDTQALGTLGVGHLWVHRALAASGDLDGALAELKRSTELFVTLRERQADSVSARRRYAHNLLYSSRLQHRMSVEPRVTPSARADLRKGGLADFEKGRELLAIIQKQGVATAEDESLLRESAAELGLSAEP